MNKLKMTQRGVIMILILITGLMMTVLVLSLSNLATKQFAISSTDVFSANAEQVAEAGIEQSLDQLNTNSSFTGYSTPQVFINNSKQGYAVFTSTFTNGSNGNEKYITSTGKIYRTSKSTTPVDTRIIKVTVVGTSSGGYSLYGGPGGITLSGSASIYNSSVYTEGGIRLSGNALLGNPLTPVNVDAANQQCPTGNNPGPTYPQVCSNGTQPISTSGHGQIYGNVCATGQTSSSGISGGLGGQGLEAGCTAPTGQMPTYDRMAQINAVTTTATGASATSGCTALTPKTWAANVKFTGNVSLSSTCTVTVSGNVYITGNLTLSGASIMKVANSVGTNRPVIIVDGTISVSGTTAMLENSSGTGIQFISFKSSNSCTTSTSSYCSSISGNDLYNSQSLQTVTISGGSVATGMIFDSYWGTIKVSGGVGLMGSIIGQTIDLSGAGTITFGTTLSSGQYTWTIRSYQQVYN